MSPFGAMLVAIGLLVAGIAVALKSRALRQKAWRRTQGTVTKSEVDLVRENYGATVEYIYNIDGRSFRGTRIYSLSVTSSLQSSAERLAAQYQVGAHVDVYVNPVFPLESVLKPGGDPSFLVLMLVFALLPLVVGIAMLVISW